MRMGSSPGGSLEIPSHGIDALYVLLLAELSCLLAGAGFFLIKSRKFRAMYQQSMKELSEARHGQEESGKRLSSSGGVRCRC